MGRRSQDSTRSPALPGLFDSKTVRPLFLTWAVVCLMAVVVGASVARSAGLALWVPVGIWIIVGLVSLWMWFNTPRDATGAFAWLMTAGVGGLLVLAAVNDLGLASPGLAFFPLVVLMLALFDLHRTRIALITTLAAVGVLWLGWREGALGASAAATLDPALKTMALRRVVVLLAALATAAICGLMLARTLRAMLLRQRAQAQAERSHELFALSPVAQVLHRDGVVLEANAAAAALFGYAHADDMVGSAIPDHFADPVDRARFDERLQELSKLPAGAAPLGMAAWRFRSRHGTLHEVRTTAAPIEIDGARAVLTTCIDDTAQLAAERARADAQSLMARIIAVSPYGIALVDLDTGHLALVNPELERITGYSREALIGHSPGGLGLWKDRASIKALMQATVDSGVLHDQQYEIVTRAGEVRQIFGSTAVFSLGERRYLLGVMRDVTQEAQQQLRRKAVLDTAPVGIFAVRHGTITLCSRRMEEMAGWPVGSGVGRSVASLMGGEAALQQLVEQTNPALLRGEMASFEWPLFRADGSPITARFSGRLIDTANPASRSGVVWTVQDVSDEVERSRLLERARLDAQAAAQAKTRFLVNTSHQLRTPLNAVLNLAELARAADTDPAQRQHLVHHIADTAQTLAQMLSDILDLQLIEDGELPLNRKDFDLGALADSLRSVHAVQAAARGLRLAVTLAPGADRWVHGDDQRVRQLLGHFLSNAVRYSESGRIDLRVLPLPGERYRFEVQDEGPGITEEDQRQLFEPFALMSASVRSRQRGGVGLGLAIARRLAQAMDGSTGVVSAPGRGSTFWAELTLPPAAAPGTGASGYDAPLKGVRLLLADDDELGTASMTLMLERWGAHVDAVSDGTQAVRSVSMSRQEGRPYDLVLMDLHMPMMDGLEATRWIRQELNELSLPIIAVTAGTMPSEIEGATAAGCNDFISKPVTAAVLLARMVQLIAQRETAPK